MQAAGPPYEEKSGSLGEDKGYYRPEGSSDVSATPPVLVLLLPAKAELYM